MGDLAAPAAATAGDDCPPRAQMTPSLLDLPLDCSGAICAQLSQRDRVSLSTASAALLAHLAAAPTACWGDLRITLKDPRLEASLAGWLSRRRAGLRKLELRGSGCGPALATVLAGAAQLEELAWRGSSLALGELRGNPRLHTLVVAPLVPPACVRLTRDCEHLSSLRRLELRLVQEQEVIAAPCCRLLPTLTGLRVVLPAGPLPAGLCNGLSGCPALADLAICCRSPASPRDVGFQAAAAALAELPGLSALCLGGWRLQKLPPQFSSLANLHRLELEAGLAAKPDEGALDPLRCLPQLAKLSLRRCGLGAPPDGAFEAPGLRSLDLSHNPLGTGGQEMPLGRATGLTSLRIEGCGLRALPVSLPALRHLAELGLAGNPSLGRGVHLEAFAPLEHLSALTRLDLGRCELSSVPAELSALAGLASLDLSDSRAIGRVASTTLAPLRDLTALTALSLAHCDLLLWPSRLPRPVNLVELRVC